VDKRTLGIILTIATVLLCGCPGLFACLGGAMTAAGLGAEYTTDFLGTTGTGDVPSGYGYAMLCAGLIGIAIPIIIGVVMLRKPKAVSPADIVPPVS